MFNETKLKFDDIFENKLSQEEIREYLLNLYEVGETASQLAGAASAMREHLIPLPISEELRQKSIDVVGTGGDKSYSFNISSTVSILLSACGCYVAKHGNRSVTSKSGSADMLEALGMNLNLSLENTAKMLEETGFAFMFAANHHPAMKYITPVRKTIPHRTIMNIVGPLSNPAGVEKQVIGVFDKSYINKIAAALDILDSKRAMILSSNDGMDEISVSDITHATLLLNGKITDIEINPENYGIPLSSKEDIVGEGPEFNAKLTRDILSKKIVGAKLDIVLLNAAAALIVDEKARDFKDGIDMAKEAIISGAAQNKLEQIIKVSKQLS
ncbi:anthranilate phosphoribosyltransferase [Aliarcobacter butzleri]|jgi:anthranilate phosphoribosyltransferase|uniref:Anthranilate phosphoribosyltransferase n=6 Tax=Aliarcobacter butzleri TaxID=28197 RepID=A0AAP4Q1F1_9BACT|nr:anthranilate phosphoribosyltransferase [Aliarcobacter butzleri]MCP3649280.1 anthranilate phosphoribosyltransferase [Arcobacter sp. DNRA7]AGR77568.1 anthranilate phosphoribosyltransferase / anthranilate synthase component II, TrpD subunit [Aliarcobacter butzleri 7h1h]KLE02607.1 anthranilate phosphoribosyltransferase [Aliarcobacter butzleri L348]KLE05509.1 anthranilate phosphoribosyltransferase [Aliarcobacter butzleri L352]KLE08415.1 anthranilate phosphoribosyltransferase [Aliarcobacter butzl